jgi:hypothetical protein
MEKQQRLRTTSRSLWQQCGSNRCLPKSLVYGVGYPAVHPGQDVRVGVQSLRYGGMTQELLHVLGVDVAAQQQRGARVAEIVEPGRGGQPGASQHGLERAHDVAVSISLDGDVDEVGRRFMNAVLGDALV